MFHSEWIHETASKGAQTIRMYREGSLEITPSLISSTLATIIIIATIVNHVYTNKYNNSDSSSKNRLQKDAAASKKHKHKKGKKGSGRMRHSHSGGGSGGRGRIRNSAGSANQQTSTSASLSAGSLENGRRAKSPSPILVESPEEDVNKGDLRNDKKMFANGEKPGRTSNGKDKSQIRTGSNSQLRQSQSSPEVPMEDDKSISSFPSCASSHATTQSSTADYSASNATKNKRGRKKGKKSQGGPQFSNTGKIFPQTQPPGSGSGEGKTRVGVGRSTTKATVISKTNDSLSSITSEKSISNSSITQSNHSRDTMTHSSSFIPRSSGTTNFVNKREVRSKHKEQEWGSPNRISSKKTHPHSHVRSSEKKVAGGRISNPNTPSREQKPDYQHYSKSSFFSEASNESSRVLSSRLNRGRSFTDPERNDELSRRISHEPVSPAASASSRVSETAISASLLPSLSERVSNSSSRYPVQESLIGRPQDFISSDSMFSGPHNNTSQNMLGDVRYSHEKLELAKFLAQVGLIGNDAQALLLDLDDIDALERLTSEDLEVMYSVGSRIRNDIFTMLGARRVRMGLERNFTQTRLDDSWSTSALVRPPPGLTPSQDPVVGVGNVTRTNTHGRSSNLVLDTTTPRMDESQQMLPYLATSASTSSSGNSFHFSSTFDKAIGQRPQSSVPISESSTSANFNLPTLSSLDPLTSSNGNTARRGFPILQNEDEEIEADLCALGGQMAGSILDF